MSPAQGLDIQRQQLSPDDGNPLPKVKVIIRVVLQRRGLQGGPRQRFALFVPKLQRNRARGDVPVVRKPDRHALQIVRMGAEGLLHLRAVAHFADRRYRLDIAVRFGNGLL